MKFGWTARLKASENEIYTMTGLILAISFCCSNASWYERSILLIFKNSGYVHGLEIRCDSCY